MSAPQGTRRISRRRFLAAAAGSAAAIVGADAFLVEPRRVQVTRHPLRAGTGGRRLVVAQLSDLHLQRVGRHEARIAAAVHAERPDLIAFTGDAVDRADALPVLDDFLGLLDAAIPRVAILGNWEHWARVDLRALDRLYARRGTELLVNRTTTFERRGARLPITGVDDLVGGRPDPRVAIAGIEAAPSLLLAHCPLHRDVLLSASSGGAASAPGGRLPLAMLAGHTHGGQLRVGGWAPLLPPGSGRYVSGWYPGALPLYVSRGLGTSVVPARFGAVPEIAVFSIEL